jgi:protein TonB
MYGIIIKEHIIRLTGAIIGAAVVFLLLPAMQMMFREKLELSSSQYSISQVLMKVQKEKPKPKKVIPERLRKIQTQTRSLRAQSTKFNFTPDLGVEGNGAVTLNNDKAETEVFDEGETDQPPVPVSTSTVPYPLKARTRGIEGTVEIVFVVNIHGRVVKVEFMRLPHEIFRDPVVKTVKNWRFKPAMIRGVPVNIRIRRKINFRLGG